MGPRARALYDRFEQMIGACGEFHTAPARTRIAFLGRVRFAGITSLSEKGMTCSFAMPHRLGSPPDGHAGTAAEIVGPEARAGPPTPV